MKSILDNLTKSLEKQLDRRLKVFFENSEGKDLKGVLDFRNIEDELYIFDFTLIGGYGSNLMMVKFIEMFEHIVKIFDIYIEKCNSPKWIDFEKGSYYLIDTENNEIEHSNKQAIKTFKLILKK